MKHSKRHKNEQGARAIVWASRRHGSPLGKEQLAQEAYEAQRAAQINGLRARWGLPSLPAAAAVEWERMVRGVPGVGGAR
jgi:hypothetical protein